MRSLFSSRCFVRRRAFSPLRHRRWSAPSLIAGLLCVVILAMLPPSVAQAATPSCDAVCKERIRLIERADQAVTKNDAVNASVMITPGMVTRSTLDLRSRTATAVSPLDVPRSVFPVESTATVGDVTLVTLVSDLLFAFDSAELTPAAQAKIIEVVGKIPQGAEVAVDGYTDSLGDDAYNLDLSQRRAEAVAAVMRDRRRDLVMTVTGHGEADPVAPNTTADGGDDPVGRSLNRRVTVSYEG